MVPNRSSQLVQFVEWHGRQLCMRPVRARDAVDHRAFFAALAPTAPRLPAFQGLTAVPVGTIAELAQPASFPDVAFIATLDDDSADSEALGVVRSAADARNDTAQVVLLLDERAKGRGLGRLLLGKVVDYWQDRGTRCLVAETASDDEAMIALAAAFGFDSQGSDVAGVVRLTLALQPSSRD
jgi:acetyltransferase